MADIGPYSTNPTGKSAGEAETPGPANPPPSGGPRWLPYALIAGAVVLLIAAASVIVFAVGGDDKTPPPEIAGADDVAPVEPVSPEPEPASTASVFDFEACGPRQPSGRADPVREASRALDILAARGAMNRSRDDDAVIAQVQAIACAGPQAARYLALHLPATEVLAPDLRQKAQAELQQYAEASQ